METNSAGHKQAECVVADCRHERGHGQRHYAHFRSVALGSAAQFSFFRFLFSHISDVDFCLTGPPEDVDHQAVGAAISTISSNLPEMAKGVKLIAALMEDEHDDRLLDATRRLCSAFSDLLNAAQPENKEVNRFAIEFFPCWRI